MHRQRCKRYIKMMMMGYALIIRDNTHSYKSWYTFAWCLMLAMVNHAMSLMLSKETCPKEQCSSLVDVLLLRCLLVVIHAIVWYSGVRLWADIMLNYGVMAARYVIKAKWNRLYFNFMHPFLVVHSGYRFLEWYLCQPLATFTSPKTK